MYTIFISKWGVLNQCNMEEIRTCYVYEITISIYSLE